LRGLSNKFLNVGVAAAFAVTLILSGRATSSAHPSHKSLPTLRGVFTISPDLNLATNLDPAIISAATDFDVVQQTNANLVFINTNDQVHPDVAKNWTISNGGKTYIFHLRHNARFSNGHLVTAGDFVFTLRRALAPKVSRVAYYDNLIQGYDAYNGGKSNSLGVKALNKFTLRINITKVAPYFLKALTYPINDVLDPAVVGGHPPTYTNDYLTNTCKANQGAGPFKFQCSNGSSDKSSFYGSGAHRYLLVPNPHFYGPKPKIRLSLTTVGNDITAYNQYLTNRFDIGGVPSQFLSQWLKHPRGQLHKAPTSQIGYLSLSTKVAPFNNNNCRLAVAWGLNRNVFVKVLKNTVAPLYTILPPGFPNHTNLSGIPKYNLAKAKNYFKACGAAAKTPFKDVYLNAGTDANNFATAEVAMLRGIGFTASLDPKTQSDWLNIVSQPLSKTNTAVVENGWIQDYPDPQDYVSLLFRCGNDYNIGEWCNTKFDKLVDKADTTLKNSVRTSLYAQASKIALNNGEPVMETVPVGYFLIKPHVKGLTASICCSYLVPKNFNWSKVHV
jgi:oligopeptide transport system substrate-binding protein